MGDGAAKAARANWTPFIKKVFAADPLVERTLGKELRDEFITYKTQEWEAYHLSVSQWEVERYSHLF